MNSIRRELINKDIKNNLHYLVGKVADFGGTKLGDRSFKIKKNNLINNVNYINLDQKSDPDILANLNDIPVEAGFYDSFLLIETLEHIDDIVKSINEIKRVVKSDAIGLISMPFLYQIHEAPEDFRRWTKKKIVSFFNDNGFKILLIKENGGYFATIFDLTRSQILRLDNSKILNKLLFRILILIRPIFKILDKATLSSSKFITTGYFFIIQKNDQ